MLAGFFFFFIKGCIKKLEQPQSTNQIHNKSFLRSFIISDVFFHFVKSVCFCCISKPIGVPSSCVPLLQKAVFLTCFEASVQLLGLSGSLLSACGVQLWLHQKVTQQKLISREKRLVPRTSVYTERVLLGPVLQTECPAAAAEHQESCQKASSSCDSPQGNPILTLQSCNVNQSSGSGDD